MRKAPDWLSRWEYAHRGLHSLSVPETIPENSLAAARAAVNAGLGIECDIQRSQDGQAMVFHDWELDQLTAQKGPTGERTRAELEQMDLFGSDNKIPSLEAFLKEVAGAVPLLIEVKSKPGYDVEQTCASIYEELKGYAGDCAVMSFDPRVPEWTKSNAPEIACGLVMREDRIGYTRTHEARQAAFAQACPDFLAYHVVSLNNPWVQDLRAEGLPVLTWTVNSPDMRQRALIYADALVSEGQGLA